jgi:hypothetical protein
MLGQKPVPPPTLSTANLTQTGLGMKPGICSERPGTNLKTFQIVFKNLALNIQ